MEEALDDDDDILTRLDYPLKQQEFWAYLRKCKSEIEAVVLLHLGVDCCQVADEDTWLFGSYNVCIPVDIGPSRDEPVLVRFLCRSSWERLNTLATWTRSCAVKWLHTPGSARIAQMFQCPLSLDLGSSMDRQKVSYAEVALVDNFSLPILQICLS